MAAFCFLLDNFQEPWVSVVPSCRVLGFVLLHVETAAHDLSGLADRADRAVGHGLHHYISDGRGLDRAGYDAPAGSVGCGLAEQAVLGAAADDVNRLNPPESQLFAH